MALLALSYLFYASWSPIYLLLLIGTAAFTCAAGRYAHNGTAEQRAARSWAAVAALIFALCAFRLPSVLLVLHHSVDGKFGGMLDTPQNWLLQAAVPLGLSFYIFEAIGYLIEVGKGREGAYDFFEFSLFISFFPHLRLPAHIPQSKRHAPAYT